MSNGITINITLTLTLTLTPNVQGLHQWQSMAIEAKAASDASSTCNSGTDGTHKALKARNSELESILKILREEVSYFKYLRCAS